MPYEDYLNNHQSLIQQLPGVVAVTSLNHKFLVTNHAAAKAIGYSNPEETHEMDYENIRCPAVEDIDIFIRQDKQVLKQHKELMVLSHFQYTNGWRVFIGKKRLLYDDNYKPIGILNLFDDITHTNMINIKRFISPRLHGKNCKKFEFVISDEPLEYPLDADEFKLVYLLMRGKSDKYIARLLKTSVEDVQNQIHAIQFKMGCPRRKQLIDSAIDAGLFNVIPKSFLRSGSS